METLKIALADGGKFFKSLVFNLLKNDFDIQLNQDSPDLVIASVFCSGEINKYKHVKKICFIGESCLPDFSCFDYVVSPHYIQFDRHFRLPFYATTKQYKDVVENYYYQPFSKLLSDEQALNRQFCVAGIRNIKRTNQFRLEFLKKMQQRNLVCNISQLKNRMMKFGPEEYDNIGKIELCKQFKFALAMENNEVPGYFTEKITDTFAAGCIPIFYGGQGIEHEFNSKTFVNTSNFKSIDDCIDYCVNMSNEQYLTMLKTEPKYLVLNYRENLRKFLLNAINTPRPSYYDYLFKYRQQLN